LKTIVVTGTDTDIGKTVFAAGLAGALGGYYWKPIQAGLDDGSDSARVANLGVPASAIIPEASRLALPSVEAPLVVEGAGGALVPVTRDLLYADLFAQWGAPVVIVARTMLGTINHSLLTIEALRARRVPILGIAFIGDPQEESEATICTIGNVERLGRLARLDPLNADTLSRAFAAGFSQGTWG